MEVLAGARNDSERLAAETLLASLRRVELTEKIARATVEIRRRHRLKLPDAALLASAEIEGCILVTRNEKDFRVSDPRVRIAYRIR